MDIKIYRKPEGSSNLIDISDYILSISGLEWRRKRDYTIVIPHPRITVPDSLDIEIDDHVYFEFDGVIRLKTFVNKIKENTEKRTYKISLNDLIKKLENYPIGTLSADDWAGYQPLSFEYLYLPDIAIWYIQIIFFIKVLFNKICNISISNIISNEIEDIDSGYKYKEDGTVESLNIKDLYFYFPQMRCIGFKSNTIFYYNKTSSLLDVLLLLLSILKIHYEYDGNLIRLKPYIYGNETEPVFNDHNIFGYNINRDIEGYNAIYASFERCSPDYWMLYWILHEGHNWGGGIIEEADYHSENLLPKKTYSILDHFELHRKNEDNKLIPFDPPVGYPWEEYGDPYYTFLEQFVELQYQTLYGVRDKIDINTILQYNCEFLVNRMLITKDKRSSDITYLRKIEE